MERVFRRWAKRSAEVVAWWLARRISAGRLMEEDLHRSSGGGGFRPNLDVVSLRGR